MLKQLPIKKKKAYFTLFLEVDLIETIRGEAKNQGMKLSPAIDILLKHILKENNIKIKLNEEKIPNH